MGQLLVHFNENEISQFDAVERVYVARDLKLYARTVSIWNPECQARPETSKARFFDESNTATSAISEANSYRVELLLDGLNRKKNSLLKKGIRDEKKKAIAYPWI